jgi:hypothetical protein
MRTNDGRATRKAQRALAALALATLAWAAGCEPDDDDIQAGVVTVDYYPYGYSYAADLAYAGWYWVDDWYLDPFYFSTAQGVAGTSGLATREPGAVLRSLARAAVACPNQVTIAPRMVDVPCTRAGGPGTMRSGVTLTFAGCMLEGGGQLDGAVDVQATPTFSDTRCDATTTVTVAFTSTFTGLAYTSPSGARVVIPIQTDMGSYTRPAATLPSAVSVTTTGRVQRYDAANALIADHAYAGTRAYTFPGATPSNTYTTDGVLRITDAFGGNPVNVTGTGVTRLATCCRPTAGTIEVEGSGRDATWIFGPSCGMVEVDGTSLALPECL